VATGCEDKHEHHDVTSYLHYPFFFVVLCRPSRQRIALQYTRTSPSIRIVSNVFFTVIQSFVTSLTALDRYIHNLYGRVGEAATDWDPIIVVGVVVVVLVYGN
jgi:hypothetical protein